MKRWNGHRYLDPGEQGDLTELPTNRIETGAARKLGLRPFAGPYHPRELWMLENLLADLGQETVVFVQARAGPGTNAIDVWR